MSGAAEVADPFLARGRIREGHDPGPRPQSVERVPGAFSVRFFEPADLLQALPQIRESGWRTERACPRQHGDHRELRPDLPDITAKLDQLARLHGVRAVEPFTLRQLRNDVAAGLMGAKEVLAPAAVRS